MKTIALFFDKHYDFIKSQAECFALSVAFCTVAILCFKYMGKLFYILGVISGLFLVIVSLGVALSAIIKAENYINDQIARKGSVLFFVWGAIYTSTVACTGMAIVFNVAFN